MNTSSSPNLIAAFLREFYSVTLEKMILALNRSKNGAETKLRIARTAVIKAAIGK